MLVRLITASELELARFLPNHSPQEAVLPKLRAAIDLPYAMHRRFDRKDNGEASEFVVFIVDSPKHRRHCLD
jgi:hypothetical protein